MIVWGVDPGVHGAIGVLYAKTNERYLTKALSLPYDPRPLDMGFKTLDYQKLKKFINLLSKPSTPHLIMMEEPLKAMGKAMNSGLSIAGSWFNFGKLHTGLSECCDCPIMTVHPLTWKKEAGIPSSKKECIEIAKERFDYNGYNDLEKPKRDGIADALLIAEYGWKFYGVKL